MSSSSVRRSSNTAKTARDGRERLPPAACTPQAVLRHRAAAAPPGRRWTSRCGKDRMINEVHAPDRQRDMPLRVLLARARHEGGGRAGRAELLTGIDGVSSARCGGSCCGRGEGVIP